MHMCWSKNFLLDTIYQKFAIYVIKKILLMSFLLIAINRECGNATQLAGLTYCPSLPTVDSGNCHQIPLTTTPAPTTSVATTKTPGNNLS